MKGSLHLPLRGAPQQIVYAHQSLYITSTHEEGLPLGVYRFPLHDWAKGQLDPELLKANGGLTQLSEQHKMMWIGHAVHGDEVWCIDQEGQVLTYHETDESPMVRGSLNLGDHTLYCLADGLYTLGQDEAQQWQLMFTSLQNDTLVSKICWVGDFGEGVKPLVAQQGPEVIAFGLSDGRVALWFDHMKEGDSWSPLYAQTHTEPICALGFVHAEAKNYVLSYSEDLTLAQTRLDDLEPMPRAAKAKGLHSTAPLALLTGPLERFYTIGKDGVKAWRDLYSNHRPVSHDEPREELDGPIIGATQLDYPVKNIDAEWTCVPALALFAHQKVCIYTLLDVDQKTALETGDDDSAQRGRLNAQSSWRAQGETVWTKTRLGSDDEDLRASTVQQLISWGDHQSLQALERVAAKDSSTMLRKDALKALISSDHPTVIHALGRLLASSHKNTSRGAFNALRKIYGESSIYPIRKALEVGEKPVCESAITALGDLGELGDDNAKTLLKDQLDHDDYDLAEQARQQMERCYASPRSLLVGLSSTVTAVQTMALHRLWEAGLTADPVVSGRLQRLREDSNQELRRYALAVTLLGHQQLGPLLRAKDALLHEELNKVSARCLSGEARTEALSAPQPKGESIKLDERARLLLFEISASGQDDIAVYGPVALALSGDLRALPTLLSLSRSPTLFVRMRATQGLAFLAENGERRARAQLERLVVDDESTVRLEAFRGLKPLFSNAIGYVELGLNGDHDDVRLTALSALQNSDVYQSGMSIHDHDGSASVYKVLSAALCRRDDLTLAQEARKMYLKDNIGGSREAAISLILESVHNEVRRLGLSDLLSCLQKSDHQGTEQSGGQTGLSGQSFLFTGTLTRLKRAEAQKRVKELGGIAASSVTGHLSYLVIGDAGKAGSKVDKAKKLGVPVISETEFMNLLDHASGANQETESSGEVDDSARQEMMNQVITQLFNDPLSSLRLEAYKRIVNKTESEAALKGSQRLETIDLALNTQSVDIKLKAIESLGELSDLSPALPRLRNLVSSSHLELASAALQVALQIADDELMDLIEEGLTLDNQEMRTLAVQAAVKAPKKQTWREDVLLRAISDGVSAIRELAFKALRGEEQVSVAAKLLDHPQLDIRDRAALTLAKVGDERALAVALDALQIPAPKADDVIAAQEAAGGALGLLDDVRWKRQVTLALSAQQRAFALANTQVSAKTDEAEVSASATGVAYAEQSLSALVSVNDEIEGAVARAHRKWRSRISAAVNMVIEGRFEGGFEVIWSLLTQAHDDRESTGIDDQLLAKLRASLKHCAPPSSADRMASLLKMDDEEHSIAWALLSIGDLRGFHAITSHSQSDQALLRAAICFENPHSERLFARLMSKGGSGGEAVLYAEIIEQLTYGGASSMMIAGLSSDDRSLRRRCADWISIAHDDEHLQQNWHDEMSNQRPEADLKWVKAMAQFESGILEQKPKGTKPHWPTNECWTRLAHCLTHPQIRTRDYAIQALLKRPRTSEEAKSWMTELRRQHKLAEVCMARLEVDVESRSTADHALTQAETEALAFGAYASLITSERDTQSLDSLSSLFHTDPMGARALLQMSLRLNDPLQARALKALEEQSDVLNLTDVARAELLISTGQSTCVERGAQLLAQTDMTRAKALILSDDGIGAATSLRALLEHSPQDAFEIFKLGFKSPNQRLRATAVNHWVTLIKTWPKVDRSLDEDDETMATSLKVSHVEVKVLKSLSNAVKRQQILDDLFTVFGGGNQQYSAELQLLVTGALLKMDVLNQEERASLIQPLKRLLASTEPAVYQSALHHLQLLNVTGAAMVALDRLIDDPTHSADADLTWRTLATLRDKEVVPTLLELLSQSRWPQNDVAHCVFTISGHDRPIGEAEIWSEMDEDQRKAEEKRAYQDDTLSALVHRCGQLGLHNVIISRFREATKTARGVAVNTALEKLTRLPQGSGDQLRECALDILTWRTQHREYDPAPLTSLIEHRHDATRIKAAMALAYGKNGAGISLLIGLARDKGESDHWRRSAIRALGVSGDLRSVKTLMNLFDDVEDRCQSVALEALGHMSRSDVADEILKRLIISLENRNLIKLAINGIRTFDVDEGWRALRKMISTVKMSAHLNLMIEALLDDQSLEGITLLSKVVREGDLYSNSHRLAAYQTWCAKLKAVATDMDEPSVILEPAIELFKTDLTYHSDWDQAVEVILDCGRADQWIELCFATAQLSANHQKTMSRFEAKLRMLTPAPLGELLRRLADAIEDAPNLAQMTLSLLGHNTAELSDDDRTLLLEATESVRKRWLTQSDEVRTGARKNVSSEITDLWQQLLWLWGQSTGGESALWSTLHSEGLDLVLYQTALFSLESLLQADQTQVTIDERLLDSAAAKHPQLSSMITRLALSGGLGQIMSDDRAESIGGLGLADWSVLSRADEQQANDSALNAARMGDAFAINTLIARGDRSSMVSLINQLSEGELKLELDAQMNLVRASAQIISVEIEEALITLAKSDADEAIKREAWRSRRRAHRRRLMKESSHAQATT